MDELWLSEFRHRLAKSCGLIVVMFQCAMTLACFAQDADRQPLSNNESATLIMNLQRNKDLCEGIVLLAKTDKDHKRDMNVGIKLYSDAMREYNSLILFLSTAIGLGEDFEFSESETKLLNDANEKAEAFYKWYTKPLTPKIRSKNGADLHGSPLLAGALIDIGVEITKAVINHFAQQQLDKNKMIEQRRAVIREGLSQCKWERWDKIGPAVSEETSSTQVYVSRYRRFRFR